MKTASPVFLSGLPRSGSTLLCRLLDRHSHLSAGATSALCPLVEKLRSAWSSEPALLARLDADFEGSYERLLTATRAFIAAWTADGTSRITIDKHRGWLFCVETLRVLYPGFRMILCVRDLRDVYGSLERQHRRTLLLRYPDETEQNLVEPRALQFFSAGGVVGGPLRALRNLGDIPDPCAHLFVVRYERLVTETQRLLDELMEWLELPTEALDVSALPITSNEADSYYRFKFPHALKRRIEPSTCDRDDLSPRVLLGIVEQFEWFYRVFYAGGEPSLQALRDCHTPGRVAARADAERPAALAAPGR